MNLTDTERSVLEMYHAGQGKCTIADVARELSLSEAEAGKHSAALKELNLLEGERMRKITEVGVAILEGREPPLDLPPTPVEPDEETAIEPKREQPKLITEILGAQFGITPGELFNIVARNVIQVGNGTPATAAEVYHVLNVMREFDLNPWMKEVHAFRHKGRLQVMMGYDGWVKKALKYPGYRGAKYEYSAKMVETSDGLGKTCWEWVECTVMSAGRIPTTVRAYLDEWYVPMSQNAREPGPWQKHTRNRLRQRSFGMAVREHCGISLWDETDRELMEYHQTTAEVVESRTATAQIDIQEQLERDAARVEEEANDMKALGILTGDEGDSE
jgi:hypothetical protein